MKTSNFVIVAILAIRDVTLGFTPLPLVTRGQGTAARFENILFTSVGSTETKTVATETESTLSTSESDDVNASLFIPTTFSEMVQQTSQAMSDAYDAGKTRQIVRIMLPRNSKSGEIGQFFEEEVEMGRFADNILVPTDETWQGGIMQLYRAAAPTCEEILRSLNRDTAGVPPKVIEDRSIDESGVDGIGMITLQSALPENDVTCIVQPTQEVVDAIESMSGQAGKRLVALVNPQWRNVNDALDEASKGDSIFGSIASFLGGKGGSLRRLDTMGFENSYTLEGYVCKGGNVRLIKRFDSDWVVFAENDDGDSYIRLGESKDRPTYQDVDKMLDDKGVTLKYARDLGLAPKL